MLTRVDRRLRRRRRRGQVLVMAMLALVLLASLVFFAFNVGDQVNRRVAMQGAADSAAIGGAAWMARSMNVVAMNNVAQTRLITNVAMLDSLPLAVQMSYQELDTVIKGLEAQLNDPSLKDDFIKQGIVSMLDGNFAQDFRHPGLRSQRAQLFPLYQSLAASGYGGDAANPGPIGGLTYWRLDGNSDPPPHGLLWRGTKALEDFSRAAYETAGLLSQATAARMGGACILRNPDSTPSSGYGSAFVFPVYPEMPAKLGDFPDFRKPIDEGRPPEYLAGTTADQIRRGPYDQLFYWREVLRDKDRPPVTEVTGQTWVPPKNGNPTDVQGKPGLSPGPPGGRGGYWNTQVRVLVPGQPGPQIGWRPYGVYKWSLVQGGYSLPNSGMVNYCNDNVPDLPPSLFPDKADSDLLARLQKLTQTKLNYMWGDAARRTIHYPHWIPTYNDAKAAATANRASIKYTWLWILRIRSSLPPSDPGYRVTAGTFYPPPGARNYDPYSCPVQKGWLDPGDPANKPQFGNAVQIAANVWQADWTYEVPFDEDIGLRAQQPNPPAPPVSGQPAPPAPPPPPLYTVYVRDQFVFFGVDDGGDTPIRNPANWAPADEKPRPYLMDLTKCDYRTDGERWYLSFLGVARQTNQATVWPGGFASGAPYRNVLALGEAHVFNNQSWDLWTQDWQARLRPIGYSNAGSDPDWDFWVNQRMDPSPGDLEAVRQYVNPDDPAQVKKALGGYDPAMASQIAVH